MRLGASFGPVFTLAVHVAASTPAAAEIAPRAAATPHPDGPPLTLCAALQEAMSANPDLLAARSAAAPLADREAQEQGLMPPRLEGQIWQWPVTTLDPSRVDMYMFMLEQELPGRGKRRRRVEAARRELAVAHAGVDVRRLEIAGEVRRAYAALGLVRRDLAAASETAAGLAHLVEAARVTYAAGGGSQAAVVRAMLQVTRIDDRVASLVGEERAAALRLNTLMGRAPGAAIGPLDEPAGDVPAPHPEHLADAAVARHPAVRAAEATLAEARSLTAVRDVERRPDWMVQGGYMLVPGEAGAWTARVGLTWPSAPWARGRLGAGVAEAEKRAAAAAAALTAVRARVRLVVYEAAARLDAARRRLVVLRSALVPQAGHVVEATRLALDTGQGSLAEALEASQLLLEARLDEARAVHELELARADLDAASGDDWLEH